MRNINRSKERREQRRKREQERQAKRETMTVRERLHAFLERNPDPTTAQRERQRYVRKMAEFKKIEDGVWPELESTDV